MHLSPEYNAIHHPSSSFGSVEWAAVATLLRALECRDAVTYAHSLRVADLSTRAARVLGCGQLSSEEVLLAGLLHDIGKLALPDKVLQKVGKLSKSERSEIARHPVISANILSPLPRFGHVRAIILQHHERFDGTGYPDGRRGDEILIESRVMTIADSFDALCDERPYRSPLTREEALGWIESEVGRQFCPIAFQAMEVVLAEMDQPLNGPPLVADGPWSPYYRVAGVPPNESK